jgi:hypothetical protein
VTGVYFRQGQETEKESDTKGDDDSKILWKVECVNDRSNWVWKRYLRTRQRWLME